MYNDCWPTSNWSIIDYYREPKPAYYAAKRACAPWLPIVMERSGQIEFFMGNDSLQDLQVEVRLGQETLEGEEIWSHHLETTVPANTTVQLDAVAKEELSARTTSFLYVDVEEKDQALPRAIFFPWGWKDMEWPHPTIELKVVEQTLEEGLWRSRIRVKTDTFARYCHLALEQAVEFSDNYFDLSARDRREIEIVSAQQIRPEQITVGHWWTVP
jgi:beta-mannosidase